MTEPLETDTLKGSGAESQIVEVKDNDDNPGGAGLKDLDRLSFLDDLEDVFIQQPFRHNEYWIEACCSWEIANRYEVFRVDRDSQDVKNLFSLTEDSECCTRQCCPASYRPFVLNAIPPETDADDAQSLRLFHIERPYRLQCICCSPLMCCGRSYLEVLVGNIVIGSVREECICCNCKLNYGIYDSGGNKLCDLSRFCIMCDKLNVGFDITIDGEETGKKITKMFGGLLKELFTSNDNYIVEFPKQLRSRECKLLLIAASMLLEYKYFEVKDKDQANMNNQF